MRTSLMAYKQESAIPIVNGLQSLWQGVIDTTEETIHLQYFENEEECRNALNEFLKNNKSMGRFQRGTIVHNIYEFVGLEKRKKYEERYYVYRKKS